jgi:glycerol-3-phosphate dehydrogenase
MKWIDADPHSARPIVPDLPWIWAELKYSLEWEMVVCPEDFLVRRTALSYKDPERAQDAVGRIAREMEDLGCPYDPDAARVPSGLNSLIRPGPEKGQRMK